MSLFFEVIINLGLAIFVGYSIYKLISLSKNKLIKFIVNFINKPTMKIEEGYLYLIFSDGVIPIEYDEDFILKNRKIKLNDKVYDLFPGIKTNHKDVYTIENKFKYIGSDNIELYE